MSTLLVLHESQENPQPPVVSSGSGTASVGLSQITNGANSSGGGSSSSVMNAYGAKAIPTGGGAASASGKRNIVPELKLTVLTPELVQAPTSVTVSLIEGAPETEVVFDIDSTVVFATVTDGLGSLGPTSVPVPESVGAVGPHTINATQTGSLPASGTFTLSLGVSQPPPPPAPDAPPVAVPDTVQRWVLQDLATDGLGSYVMPWNPSRMSPPHVQRTLTAEHTTASTPHAVTSQGGQFHVFEAGPQPVRWTFSGYCNQEMHDKLLAYKALNRRFYIIDHRSRAWKVTIVSADMVARRRHTWEGAATDWGHDYTITALIYDQEWVAPA